MDLVIFVFHYNRGAFLQNLMASLAKHAAQYPVMIFDDDSNDINSLHILAELEEHYQIIRSQKERSKDWATGGLHANMSRAMEMAKEMGAKYALMVQDDMQIVRDIDDQDLALFEKAFARADASFVLGCSFRKTMKGKRDKNLLVPSGVAGISVRPDPADAGGKDARPIAYTDNGVFSVDLYFAQLGRFETGERANEDKVRVQGVRMGHMNQPFMFFLPLPISYNDGKRGRSVRFADWLAGAGVYPLKSISRDALPSADKPTPFAEDVLEAENLPRVKYWSLHGGRKNLKSRGGWRAFLAHFLPS